MVTSLLTPVSSGALMAPTMFAEINHKRIAYREIGEGQPFIFCNRFRGVLDSWDPAFLDALALKFRVIIFDYSGIGLSSGQLATDIAAVAEDVKDLAEYLQINTLIIGGWSYGGYVAQTFSALYPAMITHTVLIGTNPPGQHAHPMEPIFLERSLKPVNDFDDEIVLFFEPVSAISRQAAERSHQRIVARSTDVDIPVQEEKFALYFQGGATFVEDVHNVREKLGQLSTPVLLLSGDHDIVFPIENWYALTRKMENLQIMMLPHAGHGPQHQYPLLSAMYIASFIEYTHTELA